MSRKTCAHPPSKTWIDNGSTVLSTKLGCLSLIINSVAVGAIWNFKSRNVPRFHIYFKMMKLFFVATVVLVALSSGVDAKRRKKSGSASSGGGGGGADGPDPRMLLPFGKRRRREEEERRGVGKRRKI